MTAWGDGARGRKRGEGSGMGEGFSGLAKHLTNQLTYPLAFFETCINTLLPDASIRHPMPTTPL